MINSKTLPNTAKSQKAFISDSVQQVWTTMIQNLILPAFLFQTDINLIKCKQDLKSLPALGHISVQELHTQAGTERGSTQILLTW